MSQAIEWKEKKIQVLLYVENNKRFFHWATFTYYLNIFCN